MNKCMNGPETDLSILSTVNVHVPPMVTLVSSSAFTQSESLINFIICHPTWTQIRDDAVHNDYINPLPHTYLNAARLPDDFHWGNVNGVSCTYLHPT